MKKTLSLALVTAMTCLAAVITAAPAAGAAVPSYTGCLSPILNAIYDVAPGDAPAHPPCLRPASAIRLSSGDLTSLAAGTGLTGGGDNGDLSVAIAPSFRLPQSCSTGQTASWNGTAWGCSAFASQADFNGLVALLGAAGTLNDSSNPVHWTKLKGVPTGFADGTDDAGPSYAAGFGLNLAGATFSVDPSLVQRRVSGECTSGSAIRSVQNNGTVGCEPVPGLNSYCARATTNPLSFPDAPCRAHSEAVDTTNNVGYDSSLAIGTDGYPAVSYRDSQGNLKLARCNDAGCVGANETLSTVVANGHLVDSTSLAIGTDGNPVISYFDGDNNNLKVARCDDPSCAGGNETISTVDSSASAFVGQNSSLAIGTDGNPVISYYDFTNGDLKVAHCNDPACEPPNETLTTIDSTGHVGLYTSLAIGTDGNPVISYYDLTNGDLKVAHCDDPACDLGGETLSTVDSNGDVGLYTSLAIGTDGNPVVSYRDDTNGDLKVAHCDDSACEPGGETLSTVDLAGDVGGWSSLAIGTDGNPVVSYLEATNGDLKVAFCNDPACAPGGDTVRTVDAAGAVGFETSLAIGTDGRPVVSYADITNSDLKIARPAISH